MAQNGAEQTSIFERHGPGRSERRKVAADSRGHWAERYEEVREQTLDLCAPLEIEDCCVQAMPEASPSKWHLAHTSWFFETFVLKPNLDGFVPYHPAFE